MSNKLLVARLQKIKEEEEKLRKNERTERKKDN
jgi:hypothetical protein